jgi:hypothetical protein
VTAPATSRPHAAKYLILLKSETAARALLFGGDHRYLAEVIDDDGLVLDNLIRAGTQCPPPGELSLECAACLLQPQSGSLVQCFALG